jgi:NAD(P)-dependent dehydrogenase (short-subunit alcohol dehydrogenase family)
MRLKNKVAVVTGGGAGIGRAVATFFAREEAGVVIAEIDPARGESTASEIRNCGGQATFVRTDVSNTQDVQAMVNLAVERYGVSTSWSTTPPSKCTGVMLALTSWRRKSGIGPCPSIFDLCGYARSGLFRKC